MNRTFDKRLQFNILAASLAALGLAAPTGLLAAEDLATEINRLSRPESEIEIGAGSVSKDSFKFGDYRGLEESGTHGNANLRIVNRGGDDAGYLQIIGRDLGLTSRSLQIEGGTQGNFGVRLEYDELPKLHSDSYQTPFLGAGSTDLTLPSGWVRGATTTAMTQLDASMQPFDVETQRKKLGLGLTKELGRGWSLVANIKEERKEGTKLIGAMMGNSPGNPRAALAPEPVDYTTDQFEALARFTSKRLQVQFGYYGSVFKNANNRLTWSNPYADSVWAAPNCATVGCPTGQLAQEPDSQFHQLNASGSFAFTPFTRLSGSLSAGRMTQNEEFLPYSVNPALTVTTPLPRTSLDGEVKTAHADLKLTSKLTPKTNFAVAYRYDDRDNRTPIDTYIYIAGDAQIQDTAITSNKKRTNRPLSSTTQVAFTELDFRLTPSTDLKLGYDYNTAKHDYEATAKERERTYRAEVRQRFTDSSSGGLGYARSDRKAPEYDGAASLADGFSQDYLNTLIGGTTGRTTPWLEVPPSRKFFLADRERDKLRVFANFAPTEAIGVQLGGTYYGDKYPETAYGLTEAKGQATNFDVSLATSETVTGHLFASLEKYETDQNGSQCVTTLGCVTATYRSQLETNTLPDSQKWTVSANDRTTTAGLGLRVKGAKFEYGGDFSYAYSQGRFDYIAGSAITAPMPLPDLVTRLKRLDLFVRYNIKTDLSVNLKYVQERYLSDNWGYDEVVASTLANVIGTNQTSPDYRVSFVGLSVSYRFR
ncbi:MAG: hypothetical protein A2151_03345 [Candidatus Muproteobacteria bacterium RBG_16_65_34]|uniref:MtrB/PioB family decaheme-associated outer membrane protein n=1 Tax=Candidatus Muproteobacteria bacterium RBG_16_65_34 TaxID=1817760 RepID=A0A1F6TRZ2_9PROT|nr:MAG: hypothetical protein A2151_03345 [Candidatus Muproteobacteria bacterium RBG_16_65_34]